MTEQSRPYATATVAVVFCDLVGSTARMARLGDTRGDVFRRAFTSELDACSAEAGGQVVKHLGDGIMVVFQRSTVAALECAHEMHRRLGELEADDPVVLRIGVSAGEVASEDGDWFGAPVVEAARLCDLAGPGRTLAPALVESLVGSRAEDHQFSPVGPHELKGLPEPMQVVEVDHRDDGPAGDLLTPAAPRPRESRSRRNRWIAIGAAFGLIGAVALAAITAFGREEPTANGASSEEVNGSSSEDQKLEFSDDPKGGADGGLATLPDYQPALAQVDCTQDVLTASPDAVCHQLIVPENRDNPGGRTIAVPVTGVPAEEPIGDPVILFDPNEPVSSSPLTESSDVWSLSPRGFTTDGSQADLCPGLAQAWADTLSAPSDAQGVIDARAAAASECASTLEQSGWSKEGYNLEEMALDIRDLVHTLGQDRVSVASGGYFTPAAVSFVRANPGAVRSLVLTNPVPPGQSPFRHPSRSLAIQTKRLAALCSQDDRCAAEFPDLEAAYRDRFEQLASAPAMVEARSLDGQGPYQVLVDGRRVTKALKAGLQSTEQLGLVPSALLGASNELAASAGIHEDVGFFAGSTALGPAFLSSLCSYDAPEAMLSEVTENVSPEFAGATDAWLPDVCGAWDVHPVDDSVGVPLSADLPVLLAEGGLSISGARQWADKMAAGLPESTVLTFPTVSEDLAIAGPQCLRRLRSDFVADPSAVDGFDVSACEADSLPVGFVSAPG